MNPAQLLIGSTLDIWYPEASGNVSRRDSAAIIKALSGASVPLSAMILHKAHGCAANIHVCNRALRDLVQEKKIVRVRTIRPYTYAMPDQGDK